jgi:hypothetical protein
MAAPLRRRSPKKPPAFVLAVFLCPHGGGRCAGPDREIDKNLLISWTSARSSDQPYNSG